ncbi:MAG: SDR family oxidoreductase, partial [Thiobacillus sp.]|nr:SDR family oxidoreductase [Thiobacillus sp.]
VLVNNAGIIHSEPLVNMLSRGERVHARESWQRVISTNLDSVFFVTGRVVDRMLARRCKGVVISISSIAANGNAGQSAYAAAKAGVNALTRTWAKELGAMGLRFVAIAPGFIDTPSTRAALSEATLARLQQQIPLRRLGELEHLYLALRHVIENDYLTGTVLEIDGGLVI